MKKCIRCGKIVDDKTTICDNCGFDFIEYERTKDLYEEPEDPIVPKERKSNLLDNPIFTFGFGILSVLASILFLFERTINVLYLLITLAFSFLTFYMFTRPAKANLVPVKKFGNILADIAVGVLIFKIVFTMFGMFMK